MWFDVYNTPGTGRDTFSLVNSRVAISRQRGNGDVWEVALWAKNLFNKYYNLYGAPVPGVANYTYRADPRSFGANLTYKF